MRPVGGTGRKALAFRHAGRGNLSQGNRQQGRHVMSEVARVTEISARSAEGFEDAIKTGIGRATQTLRGVTSAWVKEQQVRVENDQVVEYQVNLLVTFILE